MAEGVDQADAKCIGHQRTCRRTARVVPDVILGGIAAQIPHNEEVGIKTHLIDNAQFVFKAFAHLRVVGMVAKTAYQAFFAQLAQIGLRGKALGHIKTRQVIGFPFQVHVAALGNQQRITQGIRAFREERGHLLWAAQVVSVAGHLHAVRVAQQCPGLDGQHDILIARIGPVNVMHVVGGNEVGVVTLAQLQQGFVHLGQFRDVVILQLNKKVVRAKRFVVPVQLQSAGV